MTTVEGTKKRLEAIQKAASYGGKYGLLIGTLGSVISKKKNVLTYGAVCCIVGAGIYGRDFFAYLGDVLMRGPPVDPTLAKANKLVNEIQNQGRSATNYNQMSIIDQFDESFERRNKAIASFKQQDGR